MIIDSHMHAFPYLGGESGWGSVSAHLAAWQKWVLNVARPKAQEECLPKHPQVVTGWPSRNNGAQ